MDHMNKSKRMFFCIYSVWNSVGVGFFKFKNYMTIISSHEGCYIDKIRKSTHFNTQILGVWITNVKQIFECTDGTIKHGKSKIKVCIYIHAFCFIGTDESSNKNICT